MVGVMMVVLPRLHLVRATGAVNRLEKLLHHLSPPWWQAADAVLVGELMVIRVCTQLFSLICNSFFRQFLIFFFFFTKMLPLQQRHFILDNNLLLFVITETRRKDSERVNYTLNYQIRSSATEVSAETKSARIQLLVQFVSLSGWLQHNVLSAREQGCMNSWMVA